MNTVRLRQVRKLFCLAGVPRSTQRHNCRQWIRSVRFLGGRWHLHDYTGRDAS